MIGVSGPGAWPGEDVLEAQTTVLGDLVDVPPEVRGLPFLVHLPARGPSGTLVARTLGLLVDLPAELGPHGWRLADRPGGDLGGIHTVRNKADVDRMRVELAKGSAAAKASRIDIYPEAGHAFHADYRPSYRKAEAEQAWTRMLDWFKQNGL